MSNKKGNDALKVREKATESGPRVYCGPSIRGVARQYTVYNGPLPDALQEFLKDHPVAAGLLVSADKFAVTRRRVETPGTAENMLYRSIKSKL